MSESNKITQNSAKKPEKQAFSTVYSGFVLSSSVLPTMSIASPKLKNLYLSLTAVSYSSNIFSLLTRADISINNVLSGKWKLVIRFFTTLYL